jgi:DNA invertase Pin-like site-specific DNA recombinase
MKIAIYGRISTDKQETENQLIQLRAEAIKQGWEVVLEFIDVCTGGTSDRPQFQALFAAAERKEFDLVFFWSLDRLSREGTETTLRHLRILRESGVGYKSHEEQYLDTTNPFNDTFISFRADMAKEEKKRISARTKAGLALAKARGIRLGQKPVEVNVDQCKQLRSYGLSVRAIAAQLGVSKSTISLRLQAVS